MPSKVRNLPRYISSSMSLLNESGCEIVFWCTAIKKESLLIVGFSDFTFFSYLGFVSKDKWLYSCMHYYTYSMYCNVHNTCFLPWVSPHWSLLLSLWRGAIYPILTIHSNCLNKNVPIHSCLGINSCKYVGRHVTAHTKMSYNSAHTQLICTSTVYSTPLGEDKQTGKSND